MEAIAEKKEKKLTKADVLVSTVIAAVPLLCAIVYAIWPNVGRIVATVVVAAAWALGILEWMCLGPAPNKKALLALVVFLFLWTLGMTIAAATCLLASYGVCIVMIITLVIYIADAAGLGAGVTFKSSKLSEFVPFAKYSPNKSIVGTIAYLAVAWILLLIFLIFALAFGAITDPRFVLFLVFGIFVISIAGLFGDLIESWLKRLWGVKNSAEGAPWAKAWCRHGGCTDRLDSLVGAAAIPVALTLMGFVLVISFVIFASVVIFAMTLLQK